MKFKRILLKLSGEALAGEKAASTTRFFLTWPPKLHLSSSRVCKSLS